LFFNQINAALLSRRDFSHGSLHDSLDSSHGKQDDKILQIVYCVC